MTQLRAGIPIMLTGILLALIFCFVIYPRISDSCNAALDSDGYGLLALNLLHNHEFCFYKETGPTLYRGPIYPAFLAAATFLFGKYPYSAWIAQSILHGLTAFLVYLMAMRCCGRKAALVAGWVYAVYPFFIWYTPRIWNETFLSFLLISLVLLMHSLARQSTRLKAIGTGALIGLLSLTKGTFLPFAAILPLGLMWIPPRISAGRALMIGLIAVAVISPWTIRNYNLVKKIVPVHTIFWLNVKAGNLIADDYLTSPFSYSELCSRAQDKAYKLIEDYMRPDLLVCKGPISEIEAERVLSRSALEDFKNDPMLIVKKIVVSNILFWFGGDSPKKTLVVIILVLPLLIVASSGAIGAIQKRLYCLWPSLIMVLTYWPSHLPFAPSVRYTLPIMPLLLVLSVSPFEDKSVEVAKSVRPVF